ncbi:MAG TPA: NUDIX hydrolase [Ilumatobacteraceae bacterium]|nr:NUDIX hydrolase [Ilumatobacteraceae bacterium]HRB02853.1 NUDIX hydrolase [Ilumatobacteraceae bacterium]
MRHWTVGGALIRHGDGLVLVSNRRRDRTVEWTPPGGVIDEGETLLEGLAREVREETGLLVRSWAQCCYTVTVDAPDMGWRLKVEAWEVAAFDGDVLIADPDGIVEQVLHASLAEANDLLQASPPWVHAPVTEWLAGAVCDDYKFVLRGVERRNARIERVA